MRHDEAQRCFPRSQIPGPMHSAAPKSASAGFVAIRGAVFIHSFKGSLFTSYRANGLVKKFEALICLSFSCPNV